MSSNHQRLYTTYSSGEVGGDEPPHLDLHTMHAVPHALLVVTHTHTHTQLTNALSVLSTSLSHVVGVGDSLETAKALQSRIIEANQKLKVQSPTSRVLI